MKKYYAVKKGRKNGIFYSWEECRKSIEGYSSAEYKSFKSLDDAKAFLDSTPKNNKRVFEDSNNTQLLKAYVDGSFDPNRNIYSYGVVLLTQPEIIQLSRADKDNEFVSMRNVAGEVLGAICAMDYAVENKYTHLVIYYDYEGIAKWPQEIWKAKNKLTQSYVKYYKKIESKIAITFIKVQAHSGNYYNELADKLAKDAIKKYSGSTIRTSTKNQVNTYSRNKLKKSKITSKKVDPNINFIVGNMSSDYACFYDVLKKRLKKKKLYLKDIKDIYISFDVSSKTIIFDIDFKDELNEVIKISILEADCNE